MHHPPPNCAHIHCLVSINIHQASRTINGCRFFFFSAWRNSMTHFFFSCLSMADTILSDCPSTAICHIATNLHGVKVQPLLPYYQHLPLTLWANIIKKGNIIFEAALVLKLHISWNLSWEYFIWPVNFTTSFQWSKSEVHRFFCCNWELQLRICCNWEVCIFCEPSYTMTFKFSVHLFTC